MGVSRVRHTFKWVLSHRLAPVQQPSLAFIFERNKKRFFSKLDAYVYTLCFSGSERAPET